MGHYNQALEPRSPTKFQNAIGIRSFHRRAANIMDESSSPGNMASQGRRSQPTFKVSLGRQALSHEFMWYVGSNGMTDRQSPSIGILFGWHHNECVAYRPVPLYHLPSVILPIRYCRLADGRIYWNPPTNNASTLNETRDISCNSLKTHQDRCQFRDIRIERWNGCAQTLSFLIVTSLKVYRITREDSSW